MSEAFARWENFDECKLEQMQIGHDEQAAKQICEGIQERAEKGTLFKALPPLKILKSKDGELVVGGYASWEMIDEENDYVTTKAMTNYLAKFFNLPPEYRNVSIDHTNFQIGTALLHYPETEPKWFSHVHEKGMYLITKIRNDKLRRTQKYRREIMEGTYKMYSIAGDALAPERVMMDGKPVRKIDDIDPFETAIVKEGMNRKAGPLEQLSKIDLQKKVVQRDDKWCVVHCHEDGSIGETIKCFDTKEKADAMHRAIQANKSLTKDDRPPKEWMDNCRSRAQSFADDPDAFCGDLWHNGPAEKREAFGKMLKQLTVDEIKERIRNVEEKRDKLWRQLEQIGEEEKKPIYAKLEPLDAEMQALHEFLTERLKQQIVVEETSAKSVDLTIRRDAERIFRKHFPNYKGDP